jgi:protein-tyrosine phosphatase
MASGSQPLFWFAVSYAFELPPRVSSPAGVARVQSPWRHYRTFGRWVLGVSALYFALWVLVNGGILIANKVAAWRTETGASMPADLRTLPHLEAVDNHLWRAAAPSSDAQYLALRRTGVTTVVDLRQLTGPASHAEAVRLHRLGLKSVVIPVPDGGLPTASQVRTFLDVTKQSSGRVLVHCSAGVGRTGTMVAAYLVSTGQATGRQAMMRNLSVGPPTLEQLAFEFDLSKNQVVGQPNVIVRVLSRTFDEPRQLWNAIVR